MKFIIIRILIAYLFVGIFTNAFAVSSFISMPTFLAAIYSLLYLILLLSSRIKLHKEGYWLLAYWLVLTFSFILFATGEKCLNHYIMWMFSFFAFYYVFKSLVLYLLKFDSGIFNTMLNIISFSVFISSLFAIVEFLLVNFVGVNLENIIPRGRVEGYTPLASNFIRARSFMEESGHFSLYLEIFTPITLAWLLRNRKNKIILISYVSIVLIALFFSFSAYGLVALVIAIFFYLYYYVFSVGNLKSLMKNLFIVFIIFLVIIIAFPSIWEIGYQTVTAKLDVDNSSFSDRNSRIIGLDQYLTGIHLMIGYGSAAFSTLKTPSFISLYVGILMSAGICGIILFLGFLLCTFYRMLQIKNKDMRCGFVIAFILSTIHFCFVDLIYLPWFWTMLALGYVYRTKEKLLPHD